MEIGGIRLNEKEIEALEFAECWRLKAIHELEQYDRWWETRHSLRAARRMWFTLKQFSNSRVLAGLHQKKLIARRTVMVVNNNPHYEYAITVEGQEALERAREAMEVFSGVNN